MCCSPRTRQPFGSLDRPISRMARCCPVVLCTTSCTAALLSYVPRQVEHEGFRNVTEELRLLAGHHALGVPGTSRPACAGSTGRCTGRQRRGHQRERLRPRPRRRHLRVRHPLRPGGVGVGRERRAARAATHRDAGREARAPALACRRLHRHDVRSAGEATHGRSSASARDGPPRDRGAFTPHTGVPAGGLPARSHPSAASRASTRACATRTA